MWPNPQFPADLVTFTEKSFMGNFISCAMLRRSVPWKNYLRNIIYIFYRPFLVNFAKHFRTGIYRAMHKNEVFH